MTKLADLASAARARKLPPELHDLFVHQGYRAVWLASTLEPIPRYPGDNALGRPIKIGVTKAFDDTPKSGQTRHMKANSPYHELQIIWRLWAQGDATQTLERWLKTRLRDDADAIKRGWAHMDATLDVTQIRGDTISYATRRGIPVYDDLSLLRFLKAELSEQLIRDAIG